MFKKSKPKAYQPLLDDTRILLLSDNDMDKILGGFQEPDHNALPIYSFPWEPQDNWDATLRD